MFLSDHGLAQAVAADQDEVTAFGKEVQRQSPFDNIPFDLGGPGPFEVGHGFESLDAGQTLTPFQTAARAFGDFRQRELFQDLVRRPASFGGAGQEIIQLRGQGTQTDLLELSVQTIARGRRLQRGRAHRKSPSHAAERRPIAPEDCG